MTVQEAKMPELQSLFAEFAGSYPGSSEGKNHVAFYQTGRAEAQGNFAAIVEASGRGEDVTDQVLLKLLPYKDTEFTRTAGAWVHIAPCVNKEIKSWFEGKGWAKPEDWPQTAKTILAFVQRCHSHPEKLEAACKEFVESDFSKGFQTGMLTPILNALRPEDFILINNKPRRVINHFTGTSHKGNLAHYPATNASAKALIGELADEMKAPGLPDMLPGDLFDMFTHWLVAVKKHPLKDTDDQTGYWKIAPGEHAWNWEACRDGSFIAIGWDELGDVSKMSREAFDKKKEELATAHDDWTTTGPKQVWTFAHEVKVGDRIVANSGTTEVLGIGTVTGPYHYVPNQQHGHRLPVKWDDTTHRKINEQGWRRTVVKLTEDKFNTLSEAPSKDGPGKPHQAAAFSPKAFTLLGELHTDPTRKFYLSKKEEFKNHVEGPFQELVRSVAKLLPAPVADQMEMERYVFGRILKNDWGQGGAWHFYWGAFYPKGGKRQNDAQLYIDIYPDRLGFGFSIGHYGSDQSKRFTSNCQKYYEGLVALLYESFADESLKFEPREGTTAGQAVSWEELLKKPGSRPYAYVTLSRDEVLATPATQLITRISETFSRLFPLVVLAISDDPVTAIQEYFDVLTPGDEETPNPEYPLAECEQETRFPLEELKRWVRAVERKGQAILYGPPGTGKTYVAERLGRHLIGGADGFCELVQFHPAYAYEDFMQGIRPQPQAEGGLDYPLVPGRFLDFCKRAQACKGLCVLIIDEINRANLARVFGELMYLMEYRNRQVPLAGGGMLKIPGNVRIIGTMNTADRSIALVDHALRRRFAFLALRPNYTILERYHEKTGFDVKPLIGVLTRLNKQINDHHYEVGISFFLREDLPEQMEDIWRMEIEPYLEEYFFDQPAKVDEFRWSKVGEQILP